jgi:periplasmic protein TonB
MKLPAMLRTFAHWPAWKLFLAALGIGLLLGLSWQCSKRGASDFFMSSPTGPIVPAADSVPLPDVGAATGGTGGVLDAMPPRAAPPRPAPPPIDTAPSDRGSNPATADALAHPENSLAVPTTSPPPTYPADARRTNEYGTVVLRVVVEPDGNPSDIAIEQSSGSRSLDRAARQALRRWQFQPAYRNGVPVRSEVRVPVKFSLGD